MKIFVLNAGSSSQKSCLYEIPESLPQFPLHPLWEGQVDWTRQQGVAQVKVKSNNQVFEETIQTDYRPEVIGNLLEKLCQGKTKVLNQLSEIDIVGHRVVHGGEKYREATLINSDVKEAIASLFELAPAHNPANLEGIQAIEQILPNVPQVAVFDTAFHSHLPKVAAVYPIPYQFFMQGIRRYGFHGINHQYCAQQTAYLLGKNLANLRLITCHLGNGCSLAAVQNGYSIDTTMGFTPLEGLMMGTRSGSIDPGILIHLLRQGFDAEHLDELLNRKSGLKGIYGESGDMRQIDQAIAQGDPQAQLALEMYIYRLRSHIGAMLAALGGLDALIFSGGIGENHAGIRAGACAAFEFMGLKLDQEKNARSLLNEDISTPDSTVRIFILEAQEDWAIAKECWQQWHHCI